MGKLLNDMHNWFFIQISSSLPSLIQINFTEHLIAIKKEISKNSVPSVKCAHEVVKVGWILFLHGLKWIVTFYLLFLFKEVLKLLTNFIKNCEIKIDANASHYYFYVCFFLFLA